MRIPLTIFAFMTLTLPVPAVASSRVDCVGIAKQNACHGQQICIDDPVKLGRNIRFSLFPVPMTYRITSARGRIASVALSRDGSRRYEVYPPIFESPVIELSRDATTAKGLGSDFNYYFKCEKIGH